MSMKATSNLGGIAAMLGATASFVFGDTFMKLATEDLPPFEVLLLRGIAASLACAVLLGLRGEWCSIRAVFDRRTLLRAGAETLATLCYVIALARMPIANLVAILQTAPLVVILCAAFLLRERIGPARVALVLAGFAGAVMVAQPSADGVSSAALFAFGSALLIGARDLIGRGVPDRIPVTIVVFVTTVMVMVAGGAMSVFLEPWTPPTGRHLAFLSIAGLGVSFGHAGVMLAYRLGRAGVIAPFFYGFALWGLVAGLLVWDALPNPLAIAGIGTIVLAGIAIILLDQRQARRAVALADAS